jgi:hypothetical protein
MNRCAECRSYQASTAYSRYELSQGPLRRCNLCIYREDMKQCTKCHEWKPLYDFPQSPNFQRPTGQPERTLYSARCFTCFALQKKTYYRRNIGACKQYQRKRYLRLRRFSKDERDWWIWPDQDAVVSRWFEETQVRFVGLEETMREDISRLQISRDRYWEETNRTAWGPNLVVNGNTHP